MSAAPSPAPVRKRAQRRTITLDLPDEQVNWLDAQAGDVMSRSAFARVLIARAMQADASPAA